MLRASGGVLFAHVPPPQEIPWIFRVHDVNDRPGAEIFVHETHISSGELVGIYAFDGHRLRRAGGFWYGGDSGLREGFACRPGQPATIVQHVFLLDSGGENGRWQRTDTTYQWVGARLKRITKRTTERNGFPPESLTVGSC